MSTSRQSQDQTRESFGDRIWNLFASVKLSFTLLLILAAVSIVGTLLPQKEPAEVYLREFGSFWGQLILALRLNDAYHAPWFLVILGMLAANLVICSLNRLPVSLKAMRRDPAQEVARMRRPEHSFTLAGGQEQWLGRVEELLRRRVGAVHRAETDEGVVFFAQKGAWSRLAVYLVHASVLIIFAGAMVGNFFGFSGYLTLDQGAVSETIELDGGGHRRLGFAVRLDKFTVTYYPGSRMPSEYRSDITFLKGDQEVKKAVLLVNHPAEFEGIDFYQSSYGQRVRSVEFSFTRKGKTQQVELVPHHWRDLPGGGRAGIMDYRDEVHMGRMYSGPLARVAYQESKEARPMVLTAFKTGARMPVRGPVKFEIVKAEVVPYSGLQVKYDPGVWFIWVGCTLMVLGFILTFYFSHQKVWVRLRSTDKGRLRVEIAGGTNKNRGVLARLLERLAAELKQAPAQG